MCVIEEYGTLVSRAVQTALKKCRYTVEKEDAHQIGWLMLLTALEVKKDEKTFRPYAYLRVYGAVIDASRKFTRKTRINGRSVRSNFAAIELDAKSSDEIDALAGHVDPVETSYGIDNLIAKVQNADYRHILNLRFKHDRGIRNIAAEYCLPEWDLTLRSANAMSELRQKIDRSDFRD